MSDSTDNTSKDVAVPGLLRPPLVLMAAIILGIVLNSIWRLPFIPSALVLAGPVILFAAVLLFVLSLREFRAAGTSVRGTKRTTTLVRTGPYRFSRNPIYLAFGLFLLGSMKKSKSTESHNPPCGRSESGLGFSGWSVRLVTVCSTWHTGWLRKLRLKQDRDNIDAACAQLHMTWSEVDGPPTQTDMVVIPVPLPSSMGPCRRSFILGLHSLV
jgi:protein-S-isoprenylcysteine O-methyltransferase Ste14